MDFYADIKRQAGAQMSARITRRDQVADFIERYGEEHGGQSPSIQEIADALGLSKTTTNSHVQRLIEEGRAMRRDGKLWLTQPPLFSSLDGEPVLSTTSD